MKRLLPFVVLAACGPGGSSHSDGGPVDGHNNPGDDGRIVDSAPSDCTYVETADATNDTTEGSTSENSGLTLAGPTKVCG